MRFWNHDGACDGDTGGSGSTSLLDSMLSTEKQSEHISVRSLFPMNKIHVAVYTKEKLQVRKLIVTKVHSANTRQRKQVWSVMTLYRRAVTKQPYFDIGLLSLLNNLDNKRITLREVSTNQLVGYSSVDVHYMIKDSTISFRVGCDMIQCPTYIPTDRSKADSD